MIHRDALFVLFCLIVYAQSLLTRLVGRLVTAIMLAISGLGLCCLVAAYMVEAM